ITVNTGATLTLDNTVVSNLNRIGDGAAITLGGGTLNFLGAANTPSTETVGVLTLAAGTSSVRTTPGAGGTLTLTAANLTRAAGATANFVALGSTTLGSANNPIIIQP